MPVVYWKWHHVPHALDAAHQHAQPIESHAPSPVGTAARLPQIQEPLNWRHVHLTALHLVVQPVKPPLAHGPAKQLTHARTQQVEGEALPAPIICLGHVERFDLERPMRHEYECAELLAVLHVVRPLILRHGLVAKVLHQNLLVLAAQVIVVGGKLLDLDALELAIVAGDLGLFLDQLLNEVDGIPVLDSDERAAHALPEQGPGGLHVGGRHSALEELEVILTPFERVVDDELDESLGLRDERVEVDECPLVLDVRELGEVLGGIGLLSPKALLACVDLAKAADGGLEGKLAANSEADLEGLVGVGIVGEHEGLDVEGLAGSLAIADGHDIGIGELHVLGVHEEVHGHVEL
mmetsp:Transcript_4817/g.10607  ORF Transcript_4817/g.10607 Transcript_4817/m.10607 type:complete len:351 (+) Transcript_4817:122-1174(+)